MTKISVVQRISEGLAKTPMATKLIISPDIFTEYLNWDCKNQCLYNPTTLIDPPDIMGLKVKIKKGNNLLKVK